MFDNFLIFIVKIGFHYIHFTLRMLQQVYIVIVESDLLLVPLCSAGNGEGTQRCLAIWGASHWGGCTGLPWRYQGKKQTSVHIYCPLNIVCNVINKVDVFEGYISVWCAWDLSVLDLFWQRPMDLSTIEKKLTTRAYRTKNRFVQDLNLMLDNCRQFNGENSGTNVDKKQSLSVCTERANYFEKIPHEE